MNHDHKHRLRLIAIGVAAMTVATAIGFLAQEVAGWFAELLFSWEWSRPSGLAAKSAVAEPAA